MIDLTTLSDNELASLSAKILAEQRRRTNLEFQPERPKEKS